MAIANSNLVNSALLWMSAKSQMVANVSWFNLEDKKNGTNTAELSEPACCLSNESKIASNCCFFSKLKDQSEAALLNAPVDRRDIVECLVSEDTPVELALKGVVLFG